MLTVGQLAMGIAHEINTPIQFIGDNVNFLQESVQDLQKLFALIMALDKSSDATHVAQHLKEEVLNIDLEYLVDELPKTLEQTQYGVQKIADIVKAMKKFSHPGEEEKSCASINEIVRSTITVCKNEWKYIATMSLELEEAVPELQCYPTQISQVILVIVVNGAHAIAEKIASDEGGVLGNITIKTEAIDGQNLQISITDNGPGIPEAIQDKIFQPFFTTKGRGKGTGQGLSLAHSIIVENHGGSLVFETEVGVGTTFKIGLPI